MTVTPQTYVRTMSTEERIAHLEAENAKLRQALRALAAAAHAAASSPCGDRAVATNPDTTSARENSPDADHGAPNGPAPATVTR